jgi:hypothetical protein
MHLFLFIISRSKTSSHDLIISYLPFPSMSSSNPVMPPYSFPSTRITFSIPSTQSKSFLTPPLCFYSTPITNFSTSPNALSKSSFTTILSCAPGTFAYSNSFFACVNLFWMSSSLSVPRPRNRFSRISKEGGWRKR